MKEDILNREKYVKQLIEIVDCVAKKKNGYCFAIDGQWGIGKTYVLDMFENQITQIQSEEYFVFNYNCWKYDYYAEPSIAIISAMLDKLKKEEKIFGKNIDDFLQSSWGKAKEKIEEIAGEFSKNKIGIDLVELVKNVNEDTKERNTKNMSLIRCFHSRKHLLKQGQNLLN